MLQRLVRRPPPAAAMDTQVQLTDWEELDNVEKVMRQTNKTQ